MATNEHNPNEIGYSLNKILRKREKKAQKAFEHWDERSGVRVGAQRSLTEKDLGKRFWSANLAPELDHPTVRSLPAEVQQRIEQLHFCGWCSTTECIEDETVNPVILDVLRGSYGEVSPCMQAMGLRIVAEEVLHRQFCGVAKAQLVSATGIVALEPALSSFAMALRPVTEKVDCDPKLIRLMASVVTEVSITKALQAIGRDPCLAAYVRDTNSDHARDEATHKPYFEALLAIVFALLSMDEKVAVGMTMPSIIRCYFEPNRVVSRKVLLACGLDEATAATVVADAYPVDYELATIKEDAKAILQLCRQLGMMENEHVMCAFREAGLVTA